MFNVGGGELLIIFLVALVVLGPQKLPDAARQIGKIAGEFRRISSSFQQEMKSALNDPVSKVTGETTPQSLADVTTVAEVKPIEDVEQAAPAEAEPADTGPSETKHVSDPFGNKTTSSAAPVSTPSADADGARDTGEEISEEPASSETTERAGEPPDSAMFGDR